MTERYPFLDFFAGAGLVTEALKRKFKAVWANDFCVKKREVYKANHGDGRLLGDPIEKVQGSDVPPAVLSWGSFPCQDLSLAGKMEGLEAERSGLVWHWLRVMDEMAGVGRKPLMIVAENVAGLLSAKDGLYYRTIHNALVDRGYKVGPLVLNADRWVPHSRPRVFIVGVLNSINIKGLWCRKPNWAHTPALINAVHGLDGLVLWKLPEPPGRKKDLAELVDFDAPCDPPEKAYKNVRLIPEAHMERLHRESEKGLRVAPGYKRIRNRMQVLELRFDGVAGCLRTPQGGSSRQFLVLPRAGRFDTRLLTVREAARLMGADNYILPGSYNDGYKALGDAVAVPAVSYLSEHVLSKVVERL